MGSRSKAVIDVWKRLDKELYKMEIAYEAVLQEVEA
jgi:hypothetical protein